MRSKIENIVPGWNNPSQRKQVVKEIDQYVSAMGFSPEEIKNIQDPRLINMAYKAMQLDQIHSALSQKGK